MAMMYYTVTEGRANVLDRLNLRDRSTYGLDWIVLPATSAPDAVRQWRLYKAGTHPQHPELEAEAAQYRMATAGYAPVWQAERDVIAAEAAERLRDVKAQQKALRMAHAELEVVRRDLQRIAGTVTRGRPSARSRRRPAVPPRSKARAPRRGAGTTRVTAKRRRGRP
jgi:hypothetical protein